MKHAFAFVVVLFLVGCATLFDTTVTLTDVAKSAREAWADMSVRGQTTPEFDVKVKAAINKWRDAAGIAAAALQTYKAGGSEQGYINALQAARTAVNAILDLVLPIVPPAKAATLSKMSAKAIQLE